MIVMKFGGSSVESAAALDRVTSIIAAHLPRKPVVVVSAMGKTTNRLLELGELAAEGQREEALEKLRQLHAYHLREADPVVPPSRRHELERVVLSHFEELEELVKGLSILGELTPRSKDAIASYGERLSSQILTLACSSRNIRATHIDAREVIVTDSRFTQASPIYPQTYARLQERIPLLLQENDAVVLGGFIGANEQGVTTTLGRGGSDFSASIVGAGLNAEEIQIWTDVDGMLTADPRVLPGGLRVKTISFAEAAELAYFGAKVLHPSTVLPAIEKNIPVLILNSRRPEVGGTRIVRESVPSRTIAKAIACKSHITLVNIQSTRMLMAYGFLRRIFEVFDRFETSVDMIATSEVSVSLTIDNPAQLDAITGELAQFSDVTVEKDQAIVCLVGENIRYTPGVAARVFGALNQINIRMISQGASLLNLGFVVAQADLPATVAALHQEFFSNPDPAVFEPAAGAA
jgi:aspartate kinase